MKIQWEKDQRDRAKAEGLGLFASGADAKSGKWIIGGMMSHELCDKMVAFCHRLYKTKSPVEAFKATWPELASAVVK